MRGNPNIPGKGWGHDTRESGLAGQDIVNPSVLPVRGAACRSQRQADVAPASHDGLSVTRDLSGDRIEVTTYEITGTGA